MASNAKEQASKVTDRTTPAPPRWQNSERTSRIWRELKQGDNLSENGKD